MTTAVAEPVTADARSQKLLDRLRSIVGEAGLLVEREELLVYECDGYTVEKK